MNIVLMQEITVQNISALPCLCFERLEDCQPVLDAEVRKGEVVIISVSAITDC